ncbi:GyrI-like domain-containing protein [Flavihumibacter sp. CACIAM 22H1]|uniref:GyrI-like domain-containing protein n=1 Tax=Flavihumibacter sp. CACIAM 22H1 TaxID=1812911 RepID=UPI0007A8D163|nr:GyrI-like domain-containing protein [Flavihumibacter sp. CACIAM 22H1]KYP16049.1 MAG: transcriptional regulator [Flavihumibacter sp. CACIAM 22H1]
MSQAISSPFLVAGISVRTSNEAGRAGTDIPNLWNTFINQGIVTQLSNRIADTIYCVYTNYESDYTQPYTALIGCRVSTVEGLPEGFTSVEIPAGTYEEIVVKGNLLEGIVFDAWTKIWNRPLARTYQADFEVYDEKSADSSNAEIKIYIGVQN